MSQHSHQTAPTQFIEGGGIRFAYRRFGKKSSAPPLLFCQHFMGNLDNWDPAVTDGLAATREVILFDNTGIGASSGEVPTTFAQMAKDAATFVDALGEKTIDLFGFSMGGMLAQQLVLDRPNLVRKLLLIGTCPRHGENIQTLPPEAQAIFGAKYDKPEEVWLPVFFTKSEASVAAGRKFLERFRKRTDRDTPISERVVPAQLAALFDWGKAEDNRFGYLKNIRHPTLVTNGNKDIIVPTVNTFILAEHLPNALLIIYPDGNHGAQYQYPELFVNHVNLFLDPS